MGKPALRVLVACPEPRSRNSQLRSWLLMGRAELGYLGSFPVPRMDPGTQQVFNKCRMHCVEAGSPLPHYPSTYSPGGWLPAQVLPTVHTALGQGLEEDVDPKHDQESWSAQAGDPNVQCRGLGLP